MQDDQNKQGMELDLLQDQFKYLMETVISLNQYSGLQQPTQPESSQYQQELKEVQVNEIQKYYMQLQKEMEEEKTVIMHNKNQIKILAQEMDSLYEKIENFKHKKQKLKDEQKQENQKMNDSYNHIEYILNQLSQLNDSNDLQNKQILQQNQQDLYQTSERNQNLIKILRSQQEQQQKNFEIIQQNKYKLFIQIESQNQWTKASQELLNQYQTNKIFDKKEYFIEYETSLTQLILDLKKNIQKTNYKIINLNINHNFEKNIKEKLNQNDQDYNLLQKELNSSQFSSYMQQVRSLKLKIRNIELKKTVYFSKQQSIQQSIEFSNKKMDILSSQIDIQTKNKENLESYIRALQLELREIEEQQLEKEQEFQEQNYFKILDQVITYNQQQRQLKQIQRRLILLKGKLNSAKSKHRIQLQTLASCEIKKQKQFQKLLEYKENKCQLEVKFNTYESAQFKLEQEVNQIEKQVSEVQNQEIKIRDKIQLNINEKIRLTQIFYMTQQQQEINNQHDQLLNDSVNLQKLLSVLEIMKRDNTLLQSQDKFEEIGKNLINFIQQYMSITQQKIEQETNNHNNLIKDQQMLNRKIYDIENQMNKFLKEKEVLHKLNQNDQIDKSYLDIDFQLNQTLNNIQKSHDLNSKNYFQQFEIFQQTQDLKQSIDEKNNSQEHIRLKQEAIQQYIEYIENQQCFQEQLYEIEAAQNSLNMSNLRKIIQQQKKEIIVNSNQLSQQQEKSDKRQDLLQQIDTTQNQLAKQSESQASLIDQLKFNVK